MQSSLWVSKNTLVLYQKGGSKSNFVIFVNKNQVKSNKLCFKVSLCENFQRQSCSRTIPLSNSVYSNSVYMLAVNVTLEPNISPKVTHALQQRRFQRISASAVRASEKSSIIVNRKSAGRFPTSYRWIPYGISNSPKGGSKSELSFRTDSLIFP